MNGSIPVRTLSDIRVLITGATGFIGRHLCKALVDAGAQVFALRRPDSSSSPAEWASHLPIEWLEADLCDLDRLKSVIKEADASHIFHLAAATAVDRGFETAQTMIANNLQGTINLLHALEATSYACFIQTGSAEEYGMATAPFRETTLPQPVSPYSASKASAALFCDMYHRTLGSPIIILRPFLVYGPDQPMNKLIPQAIQAALKDQPFPMTSGRQTREFTYIDDLISGYLKAAVTPEAIGHTINLGTGITYTILEVVELISQLTGSRMELQVGALPDRVGEIMLYQCDNTKAEHLLDWVPETSLNRGLKKTIDWYRLCLTR
jgi:UDP-glucose 4-epimerase